MNEESLTLEGHSRQIVRDANDVVTFLYCHIVSPVDDVETKEGIFKAASSTEPWQAFQAWYAPKVVTTDGNDPMEVISKSEKMRATVNGNSPGEAISGALCLLVL